MNKVYPKGSEWRKWDLHFHTPSSYDYQEGSVTNEDIVNGLIENEISVVAITDHHTIDIERISILQKLAKGKGLTILPGIEFLSDARGNEPIHFIGIFDENSNIEFIWAQIKNNTSIKRIEGEQKKINEVYCDLDDTIKLIKELGGIISIHAGSKSNSLENITHSLPQGVAQKEDIARAIDIFELGKVADIDPYQNLVNPYLIKTIGKTIPTIICSDNHNIKNYIKKANLWIKADPTFEGLKQIIYEPEERVSITDRKPDEKKVYEVIDKVRFIDPAFTTTPIECNENMTAIIGGKSTGKSILLKSTAKTADIAEYNKRNASANIIHKRPVSSFEVIWKDGQVSSLGSDNNPAKKIIYIPQSYLNRVVDDGEDTGDIDEIIQDVLLQKEEFKAWYDSLNDKKKEIANKVDAAIKSLFENIGINIEKSRLKKDLGDEGGIKKQIDKLNEEIKGLQEKSKISKEELDTFNQTNAQIKEKSAAIDTINKDIAKLKSLKDISIQINENLTENIINPALKKDIEILATTKTTVYKTDWATEVDKRITGQETQILTLTKEIEVLETSIKDMKEALKDQNVLNELMKDLGKEEKILLQIAEFQKEITNSYKLVEKNIQLLADNNAEYYSLYLEAKDSVDLSDFDDDLSFDILTKFKKENFQESYVQKSFDGRATASRDYDYLTQYEFAGLEEHKTFLKKEALKIIKGEIPKRKGLTNKEAITSLFTNWFMHDYKVTFQDDDISDMSPGKKSFVLLRLLIDLDDSQCPILIDQPEDDLDNRSIYNQVVKFLRKRKRTRQIIIVTHNPNLVLGADAELIIVANQDGEGTKNRTHPFEYISGSIEYTKAEDNDISEVLYKRGVQEHICDVLEGGPEAFDKRKKKYNF